MATEWRIATADDPKAMEVDGVRSPKTEPSQISAKALPPWKMCGSKNGLTPSDAHSTDLWIYGCE